MRTILHISKYYAPHDGGIESVAKRIVQMLPDYQNIVVCFSDDRHNHHDMIDGVEVYRVGVIFNYRSQDICWGYLFLLWRLVCRYHPDAIHVHAPNPFVYPLVIMVKPRICKLVVHWHSDILGKGKMYFFVRGIEKKLLDCADRIIVTSPNYVCGSQPLKSYAKKITIVANGVDTLLLQKRPGDDEAIEKIKAKWNHKPILFFIGRHVYYKGLDYLIEAEPFIHSDLQILIAGNGPLMEQYRAMAQKSSRIYFLGRISEEEHRQYLWAADVFAFPSISKAEAFGMALAEAMYCQCVPVVFHIPGSGVNWVNKKDITGLEVPLKDVVAYAEAVNQLLADPVKIGQMGKAAHNYVASKFSLDVIQSDIHFLYQQIFDN